MCWRPDFGVRSSSGSFIAAATSADDSFVSPDRLSERRAEGDPRRGGGKACRMGAGADVPLVTDDAALSRTRLDACGLAEKGGNGSVQMSILSFVRIRKTERRVRRRLLGRVISLENRASKVSPGPCVESNSMPSPKKTTVVSRAPHVRRQFCIARLSCRVAVMTISTQRDTLRLLTRRGAIINDVMIRSSSERLTRISRSSSRSFCCATTINSSCRKSGALTLLTRISRWPVLMPARLEQTGQSV